MASGGYRTVDEYIATHPEHTQAVLQRVRAVIRRALPRAEEGISYRIPVFRIDGRAIVYFAGWKEHYAIYPATAAVVTALADGLAGYEVSKGTIRFPLGGRVPAALIGRIARLRASEEAERAAAPRPRRPSARR